MSSKLFLVQVDATEASATTRWRPQYNQDTLPTIEVFVDDLRGHLCEKGLLVDGPTGDVNAKVTIALAVEVYDPIKSTFTSLDTIEQLHSLFLNNKYKQATQILVKNVASASSSSGNGSGEIFMIRGRAFDTSQGLTMISTLATQNNGDSQRGQKTLLIAEPGEAHLGTGLNTWDGSIVLAKYLERHQHQFIHHKNILEVGAGTGIAGMASAWLGANHTILTDLPYVLTNLQNNIHRNFANLTDATSEEGLSSCSNQQKEGGTEGRIQIEARALDWMDSTTYPIYDGQQWDVILGADVVWIESLIPSLVQTLATCANENTTVLISHQTRSKHSDDLLYRLLGEHFEYSIVDRSEMHATFSVPEIHIIRAKKRRS